MAKILSEPLVSRSEARGNDAKGEAASSKKLALAFELSSLKEFLSGDCMSF
jgi:hypothetical protein